MSFSGLILLASLPLLAQDQTAGQRAYDTRGRCHGGDGRGSDMAPSMLRGVGSRDDAQFTALIRLTWATGMTPEGRPIKAPNQEPSAAGTYVCPSQDGASNFYSPSYIPSTGLFYFHAFEKCSVYTKRDQGDWTAGKAYLGGSQQTAPGVADH